MFRKILVCPKKFFPLKWYTDRTFFGDGGGWEGGRQKKFSPEKFFGTKMRQLPPGFESSELGNSAHPQSHS